jgi:hypothetical protein
LTSSAACIGCKKVGRTKPVLCCGRLRSGEPCTRPPPPGEKFCRYHSPEARVKAQLHGRRGGRPPTSGERVKGCDPPDGDLAETVARARAAVPGCGLSEVAALALREYQRAATPVLRLRALALLLAAHGKIEETAIARTKLLGDDADDRTMVVIRRVIVPAGCDLPREHVDHESLAQLREDHGIEPGDVRRKLLDSAV